MNWVDRRNTKHFLLLNYKMNETLRNINGTSWQTVFILSWFGTISMIIAILNTGICVLLWTQMRLHNTSNLFFVNLAIADILVGFVAIPWKMSCFALSPVPQWLASVVTAVDYVLCLSFLGICALTYDRYQAILYPLTYCSKMAGKNVWKFLFLIWILPGINFFKLIWMLSSEISFQHFNGVFDAFLFSAMLLATGGIVFAYVRIFRAARIQEHHVRKLSVVSKRNQRIKLTKAIRSCLGVTICFGCCWLPRGTYLIARTSQFSTSYGVYDLITFGLMSLSPVLNPIIYSFFNRDIRRTLEVLWNRYRGKTRLQKEMFRSSRASSLRTFNTVSSRENIELSSNANL